MSLVHDLITLEELAEREEDPARRRALDEVRARLAGRDRGAKVSEAAHVLGISQPTVRSWVEAGVLPAVPGVSPVRVEVMGLAHAKRAVDLLRAHREDRHLLAAVMRHLRDRAVLTGDGAREGFADLAAGRVVPLTDALLDELDSASQGRKRSASI